jgi:hypothetical protein
VEGRPSGYRTKYQYLIPGSIPNKRIIRSLLDVTTRRSLEGVRVQKDFVYMIPLVRWGLPNLPLGNKLIIQVCTIVRSCYYDKQYT